MNTLIKSSAARVTGAAIQSFEALRTVPAVDLSPSAESVLEARVADLERELQDGRERLASQLESARLEGAREALEQRSDAEMEKLRLIENMVLDAKQDWLDHLGRWQAAAVGISREVLEHVFGESEDKAGLIEAAVRQRLAQLEAGAALQVRVSIADFSSAQSERAAERFGPGVELRVDPLLRSGECLIDLKLGHIDVGIGAQWARISRALETIECDGLRQ